MSWCMSLLILLLSMAVPLAVQAKSFPSVPDATLAQQQHWGSFTPGYITDGCWHGPSATTAATIASCRAFALDTTDPATLKGFEETTPRTLTYSGGDGTYWLAGRWNPSQAIGAWTCLAGTHYCWVKLDTPPLPVDGVVLLGKVTVAGGAITAFTVMAPWRRTTPAVIPAGTTVVLGVCPEAGRWHLFDANGTTSGLVRFGPGACGEVYPEWWGADPTGLADATAAWQQAIDAVSGLDAAYGRIPIACEGVYTVVGPLTVKPRLNIVGGFKVSGTGDKQPTCSFHAVTAGDLFVAPEIGQSYSDMDFRHMRLVDVDGTADKAFNMRLPTGLTMDNIFVQGFKTPWYFNGQIIYSRLTMLGARFYRERCMEITATANFAAIEVHCGATTGPDIQHGVRVGFEPALFGSSTNLTLRASVEASSGLPFQLGRIRGLNAELYVEQPGVCADYSAYGAVYLRSIEGGRIHITASGNCSGGPPQISRGIYIVDATAGDPEAAVPNTSNLTITGRLFPNYALPVVTEPGPGQWGINLTGLDFEVDKAVLGDFTTGMLIGGNYWTHGAAPALDQGRGATHFSEVWSVGDVIQLSGGLNQAANMFWQVTVAGNPPTVERLWLPGISDTLVLAADTTPSVRKGNTYMARLRLEAGSAITMLDDPIGGLCVDLKADGARTITHGPLMRLLGASDYPMAAGNTLRLCADGPSGPWRETSRCATCVP